MLIAARKQNRPVWLPVMGAEVLFDPIDRPMLRRARRAALLALGRDEAETTEADAAVQLEDLGDALSHALITAGVRDWRDVGTQIFDADDNPVLDGEGQPTFEALPFSAENLAIVLADPITFDAFDTAYVMPFARRERAKNGSAVSPSGTGEAGTRASNIATSPAKRGRASVAKRARTGSKPRKTTTPKRSGKS